MEKIVLDFYSCYNLGDDLFVKTFSESFSDYSIRLLVNPKCIPKDLSRNVRIHPYSFLRLLLMKAADVSEARGLARAGKAFRSAHAAFLKRIQAHCTAYVRIGGSIFMEHAPGCREIDFSTEQSPDFSFREDAQGSGNAFIIGANLGPVYSETYWDTVKTEFQKYRSVCLRDYASYRRVQDCPNVQYAPDVLFLVPKPNVTPEQENVVISVIDIAGHTTDERIARAYYDLLAQAIAYFQESGIPVTLVSFCQWQGDERAAQNLLRRFPNRDGIAACFYRGESAPVLEVLAKASFVVGSRFHSIILGMSFGKPVFPILYNCKTAHYLADCGFTGRTAALQDLPSTTLEDLLFNYREHILTDCTAHHTYAVHQFRALRHYLEQGKGVRHEGSFI